MFLLKCNSLAPLFAHVVPAPLYLSKVFMFGHSLGHDQEQMKQSNTGKKQNAVTPMKSEDLPPGLWQDFMLQKDRKNEHF